MARPTKSLIPSLATFCNLGIGFLAIAVAMEGDPYLASLLVIAAVIFDSLDGALARMLGATSDFGMEMDSLADMVSFGVAPAVIVGSLLPDQFAVFWWLVLVAFPICAAIRLARFNIRTSHSAPHGGFIGLATTGAGGCVAAAVLAHAALAEHGVDVGVGFLPWTLLVLSLLMVSTLPYPHMGSLLSRISMPSISGLLAIAVLVAAYWEYELVFLAMFCGYVASGPALALGEKIRAFHAAHSR